MFPALAVSAPDRPAASDPGAAALGALSLQACVVSHTGFDASAMAFATELAKLFGCRRAAVGFLQRGFIRLRAVSHGQGEALDGEAFDPIALALDEAVQQAASVRLPTDAASRSMIRLAHARLLQRRGGAVASVPLIHAGEIVGAVCCEWAVPPDGFDALLMRIETAVSLAAPVLNLLRQSELGWRERTIRLLGRGWRRAHDLSDRRTRIALVALLALAVVLGVLPFDYRVGGRARLEGESQRSIVAPSDGFLRTVHVRPGDHVVKGQVLIEMADQELELQRRKWASELAQQESAHAVALARADRAAMVTALARADEARAQLALVDADLARTRIVAPFDGVVIQGDLAQSAGAPVERGKPLLVVVPGSTFRVVVDIDERDVAAVRAGQPGALSLAALLWESLPLSVTRVTPIARAVDGNNVFEVEAEVRPGSAAIRPGLEGVAKIVVGREPLAWTTTHRLVDWLRLKAWSWWA